MKEKQKSFLFLQGPHGPFYYRLGKELQRAGIEVKRVGFNAGDRLFWPNKNTYIPFRHPIDEWEVFLRGLIANGVTDIVLYGDGRPVHIVAKLVAEELGVNLHYFEEGYLRPHWVTYERGGVNGHSRLMDMGVSEMEEALTDHDVDPPGAPANWGALSHHVIYGFFYHAILSMLSFRYPDYQMHRNASVKQELGFFAKRLFTQPYHMIRRRISEYRLKFQSYNYHLVLLQLGHDSSLKMHSRFDSVNEFITETMRAFAKGAPKHNHILIKSHPLEDDRFPIYQHCKKVAQELGITDRVHVVYGGRLGMMLDRCMSVVTINSTAGQQALWRGLPLKALGNSVYNKPEFNSEQRLSDFFKNPMRSDKSAYDIYRTYLLNTSQIYGGFYTRVGRANVIRQAVIRLLQDQDTYDAFATEKRHEQVNLQLVSSNSP